MGSYQTYKLLYNKGNHRQKENLQNGRSICKQEEQGINFQNTQTTQQQQ